MTLLRLALKGIKAHPLRLILTGLAVLIGVSFVASSFIISDSLKELFGALGADANAGIDATVRPIEEDFGTYEPLDESLVDRVAAVPEVGGVEPAVFPSNFFSQYVALNAEGEEVVPTGPPVIVFSWNGPRDDDGFRLIEGRPGRSTDEVVLDDNYVEALGASIGDRIRFNTADGEQTFTLVGTVSFEANAGAYFVLFDFLSAQTLFEKEGQVDQISLFTAPGVTESEMVAAVAPLLDEDTEVVGQTVVVDESAEDFNQIINIFRNILLGFAIIALFVSLFIIYNTFAILVSQRTREFGLLRAIGATSDQILISVVLEALVVGFFASIMGLGGGVVVAKGIKALLSANGGFPETKTIITSWTVLIALGCGIGATVASVIIPAYSAGRISPVAAMRNESPPKASLNIRIAIGTAITVIGLALVGLGLFTLSGITPIIAALGSGALLTFLGVAALSVLFAGKAVSAIGSSFGRKLITVFLIVGGVGLVAVSVSRVAAGSYLSAASAVVGLVSAAAGLLLASNAFSQNQLAGHLARQNASRSPRRTAATATALMIGLALVTTVSVMGESLKASFVETADNSIHADVFIYNEAAGESGIVPADLALTLADGSGVGLLSPFRLGLARVGDDDVLPLSAWDSSTGGALIEFEASPGSLPLSGPSMLVHENELADRGWSIGDQIPIEFEDGAVETMTVAGEFVYNSLLKRPVILVDLETYNAHYPDADDTYVALNFADGADPETVVEFTKAETNRYPNALAVNQEEFRQNAETQVDSLITTVNAMLGLTLVIALLGIINTIALSVTERTREIGLLRAVGMTRQQLARSVRWEAVIVSVFGAILGIILGMLFAYAAIRAVPDGILGTMAIPYQTIGTIIMASAVVGVLAAVIPAYFAGRKDVLAAIASE